MHTRNALVAVLMTCAFIGCSKTETTPAPATPTQDFTAYKPVIPEAPRERESLLREQLELERQKAELEKLKLEHQLQVERQKSESERQRRSELERHAEQKRLEAEAQNFTSSEYSDLRQSIVEAGNTLGRALISRTHPTGKYVSTERPSVNLSPKQDAVTATILVRWKGGFSENEYETAFTIRITKKGLDRLEVQRDTAIIQIDPDFLRRAESDLRAVFDPK